MKQFHKPGAVYERTVNIDTPALVWHHWGMKGKFKVEFRQDGGIWLAVDLNWKVIEDNTGREFNSKQEIVDYLNAHTETKPYRLYKPAF